MNANDIIDEAFDEFANQFDHESNEWLDMDVQMIFAAGWKAALKSSLPAETVSEAKVEAVLSHDLKIGYGVFHKGVKISVVQIAIDRLAARAALAPLPFSHDAALAHADDGWRPIEDGVPKDGTGILVWIKGAELPFTARWSVARNRWVDMQNDESVYTSPTHWRPLPPLPKDGRK